MLHSNNFIILLFLMFYMNDFFEEFKNFEKQFTFFRNHFFFKVEWVKLKLSFKKLKLFIKQFRALNVIHKIEKHVHILNEKIEKIMK